MPLGWGMGEKFLDKAYSLHSAKATQDLYNRWAVSNEAEVAENGYATPARVADALWDVMPDADAPILDFGCGTGLSGLALRREGYEVLDGVDPSPEMIARALRKQAYRHLEQIGMEGDLHWEPGTYRAITGIGVLGTGAAPAATFDRIMSGLAKGGYFAFSYNDHALADAAYTAKLNEWLDCGAARLLFQEHGPHLPGLDLNATVYVIEKA